MAPRRTDEFAIDVFPVLAMVFQKPLSKEIAVIEGASVIRVFVCDVIDHALHQLGV